MSGSLDHRVARLFGLVEEMVSRNELEAARARMAELGRAFLQKDGDLLALAEVPPGWGFTYVEMKPRGGCAQAPV